MISQAELQRLEQLVEALNTRLEQALAKNQTLQATLEQQAKELHQAQQALTIRDEALHKQAEHQQQLEAELLFVRAALAEEQKKPDPSAELALWQQRYLSLQADVDNLRRRWEQRAQTDSAEHRRQILADMLPLADHLDLALAEDNIPRELEQQETRIEFPRLTGAIVDAAIKINRGSNGVCEFP